jgi:DNA-binding MarR family transcriptional regulator/GNAT superfamily N-acetyltransferase
VNAIANDRHVAALRAFNRFYTRRIGVLQERLLHTDFTLAQSRLLWELAHHDGVTAATLARELDLDAGYLSRLLRGLKEHGLLKSSRSKDDARQTLLRLSAAGRRAFAPLDQRSHGEMSALLARLNGSQQRDLLAAMACIEALLGDAPRTPSTPMLRAMRPGDIGWVTQRHGELYAREYGWDMSFEALVAHIAARYVEQLEARHECAWIAELDGENAGCVFLVQARGEATNKPERGVAQLRLLLVEPWARGHGLGSRLVDECERFARAAGYRRIRLWTNSVLLPARAIYQKAGYALVASEPHHSFGHDLVGETWELAL